MLCRVSNSRAEFYCTSLRDRIKLTSLLTTTPQDSQTEIPERNIFSQHVPCRPLYRMDAALLQYDTSQIAKVAARFSAPLTRLFSIIRLSLPPAFSRQNDRDILGAPSRFPGRLGRCGKKTATLCGTCPNIPRLR